jgi:hypothetical protein
MPAFLAAVPAILKGAAAVAGKVGAAKAGAGAAKGIAGKGGGMLSNLMGGQGKGMMGNFTPANVGTGLTGLGQIISGNRLQRKADAAMPASEDPEMRSAQLQAQRRARAFRTGTASASQRAAAAQQLSTGQKRMMQMGAGGRKGLLQMQQVFGQSMQQMAQSDLQGELAYQKEANRLLGEISQRALDVQMQKHDELAARAATRGKAGRQNLGAAMGKRMGLDEIDGTEGRFDRAMERLGKQFDRPLTEADIGRVDPRSTVRGTSALADIVKRPTPKSMPTGNPNLPRPQLKSIPESFLKLK